jgi:long-chain acyl-CoA synthetase
MIVSKGGKNIYPGPIEERFVTNPLVEQIMVVGEGREFLTALVVPNLDTLRDEAKARGLSARSDDDLLTDETLLGLFTDLFREDAREAASHEKIRDVRLVAEPFTVENDLLTPTLKLKRSAIEARHADLVEAMYADVV